MTGTEATFDRAARVRAWAVHAFTASGAVLGFLALVAVIEGDLRAAFLWLGAALLVDGIDGTLARKARVREVVPQVDGAILDHVIDFFTYVVVPAMMIYWYGFVPEGWATAAAALVMAVSCYTFANVGMKSEDYCFVGFPALWNLIAFGFYVTASDPWLNLCIIVACAVLTFVPIKVLHPIRVRWMRPMTLIVTLAWALASLAVVVDRPTGEGPLLWVWLGATAYFVLASLWRTLAGPARQH